MGQCNFMLYTLDQRKKHSYTVKVPTDSKKKLNIYASIVCHLNETTIEKCSLILIPTLEI